LWAPLESFSGPVLLVRGERGFLSAEDAAELGQRVPGAQVVEVPAGHNIQEELPVELADIVTHFIASTN
jgi:pimeloyl-ACP methyl ester carboxylesterase